MPVKLSINKKYTAVIAFLLVITIAAGVTVAYIAEKTEESNNTFVPVYVGSSPANNAEGVSVMNTGDIPAYLRATVVVNWVAVDGDGNSTGHYHSSSPKEGLDFEIEYDDTGAWLLRSDGYWYHRTPVGAGATSESLITSLARLSEAPEGYKLSVEILTAGIQAAPTTVVADVWGVTVDGILIKE